MKVCTGLTLYKITSAKIHNILLYLFNIFMLVCFIILILLGQINALN